MVGSVVQTFHGELDTDHFYKNSFSNNGCLVALAPGDGLMLERVSFDKYNEYNKNKKSDVMI
jgi:tRNA U38,U39,U40 pseudouridine synthase TruA